MTITMHIPGFVAANGLDIYVEQVGHGPDVLLIGGLGDTSSPGSSSSTRSRTATV